VNFDVESAPGAAPTLAARCSPAPALARKMEIPALEAPVPRFECAVLNADALLDADGEAEGNDTPTALRSAAAASGAQSRVPTVTHSSTGSSRSAPWLFPQRVGLVARLWVLVFVFSSQRSQICGIVAQ
jgi:hypothetical protein